MSLSSLFPWAGSRLLTSKFVNEAGTYLIGAASLWWVVAHVGPQTGTVVIHVSEPRVSVSVGGMTFPVGDDTYTPFVYELPAGKHQLTMSRGDTILYAETFALERGEERVLTACRPVPKDASQNSNAQATLLRRGYP